MADETLLDRVRTVFERSRFQQRLGAECESAAAGECTVALPLRSTNANRSGNLHGGAHASLMMSAASMATASTQREPSVEAAVSIRSIAISYIGAARNVGVRAYAKVVRRGRDAAHVTVHVDSETGDVVAIGNLSVAIYDADVCASSRTDSGGLRRASLFTRLAAEKNEPVLGSPFLEESGLAALEEQVDDWQSLLLPVAPNEDRDRHIDDGAVVGLIDNCGSMAAYTSESVNREMLGTTISLAAVFATPTRGPVIGSGRLLTQLGTALTSEVEIWSPDDGSVRAAGSVCYRIPGAGTV